MSNWKVERIEIQRPEQRLAGQDEILGIPPDHARCVVFARTADGRPFTNEAWIPVTHVNIVGEARMREILAAEVIVPEDDRP